MSSYCRATFLWFYLWLFRFRSTHLPYLGGSSSTSLDAAFKKIWGVTPLPSGDLFVVFFVCSSTHFFDHVRIMRMLNANENTIARRRRDFQRTIQSWLKKMQLQPRFFYFKIAITRYLYEIENNKQSKQTKEQGQQDKRTISSYSNIRFMLT
jgi:hypothetical protein